MSWLLFWMRAALEIDIFPKIDSRIPVAVRAAPDDLQGCQGTLAHVACPPSGLRVEG